MCRALPAAGAIGVARRHVCLVVAAGRHLAACRHVQQCASTGRFPRGTGLAERCRRGHRQLRTLLAQSLVESSAGDAGICRRKISRWRSRSLPGTQKSVGGPCAVLQDEDDARFDVLWCQKDDCAPGWGMSNRNSPIQRLGLRQGLLVLGPHRRRGRRKACRRTGRFASASWRALRPADEPNRAWAWLGGLHTPPYTEGAARFTGQNVPSAKPARSASRLCGPTSLRRNTWRLLTDDGLQQVIRHRDYAKV